MCWKEMLASSFVLRQAFRPCYGSANSFFVDRNANEHELRRLITGWAAGLTREQALGLLRAADVPAAPVWSLDDLIASGHIEARGMLQPATNGKLGSIRVVPQPVQFDASVRLSDVTTPMLGQHTHEVLTEHLGLEETQIAALRSVNAI
jgi:CoA:oxalate CoA-transferase